MQTQEVVKHLFRELLGRRRPPGPQPRSGVWLRLTKQKKDGAAAQEPGSSRHQTQVTLRSSNFLDRTNWIPAGTSECAPSEQSGGACFPERGNTGVSKNSHSRLRSLCSQSELGWFYSLIGFYSPLSLADLTEPLETLRG